MSTPIVGGLLLVCVASLAITACAGSPAPVSEAPLEHPRLPLTPPPPDPSGEGWFCYDWHDGAQDRSGCARSRSQCDWLRSQEAGVDASVAACEPVAGTVSCAYASPSRPPTCGKTAQACRRLSAALANGAPCGDFKIPELHRGYFGGGGAR
jgi:hypothetical protein